MATNTITGTQTLFELGKRIEGGKAMVIAKNLARNNELLSLLPFREANNSGFHKHLRQLVLPTGSWRGVGEGVAKALGQTVPVDEPLCRHELQNEIDEAAFDMIADAVSMRRDEDLMALEGVGQGIAYGLIYGPGSKGLLNGLFTRYFDPAAQPANVIDNYPAGSGAGYTSALIMEMGETGVYGIYPKGSKTFGINAEDMGRVRVSDPVTATKWYFAWITRIYANLGLCIRDERAVQRVGSIKTGAAKAAGGLDDDNILRAINKLPALGQSAATRIFVNREVKTQMDILAKAQTNINYSFGDFGGHPVTLFRGIAVSFQESISANENAI